jgi:phosphoribosyl-dephospho-CoA transferase
MISPVEVVAPALCRHDLVWVSAEAWRTALALLEPGESRLPGVVHDWVLNGRPLIARRATLDDHRGVALGLPLPPAHGKQRLSFDFSAAEIVSRKDPPLLAEVIPAAPGHWQASLEQIVELAATHQVTVRVFGSLAWQHLTGLPYLSDRSDADLLFSFPGASTYQGFSAALLGVERTAPMRLDGEWIRSDGAAVNWRELHAEPSEILIKTLVGVRIARTVEFLGQGGPL